MSDTNAYLIVYQKWSRSCQEFCWQNFEWNSTRPFDLDPVNVNYAASCWHKCCSFASEHFWVQETFTISAVENVVESSPEEIPMSALYFPMKPA